MEFNGFEIEFLGVHEDHTLVTAKNAPDFYNVIDMKRRQSGSIFKNPRNDKIQINNENIDLLVPESIRLDLPYFHEGLFDNWDLKNFEEDLGDKIQKTDLTYCASIDKEFSDFFDSYESQ